MKWYIRCKAIQNNEHDGIKKNRVYTGIVIGDNADEATISIYTPNGRVLYFADGFRQNFVLVAYRNADIVVSSSSPCDIYGGCAECPYYTQEFGCTD